MEPHYDTLGAAIDAAFADVVDLNKEVFNKSPASLRATPDNVRITRVTQKPTSLTFEVHLNCHMYTFYVDDITVEGVRKYEVPCVEEG